MYFCRDICIYISLYMCIDICIYKYKYDILDFQTFFHLSSLPSIDDAYMTFRPFVRGYSTIMELTSDHPTPWATDPQLQRPAIVSAVADGLVKTSNIRSNRT